MNTSEKQAITGAFGFSGRHIARMLLASGARVLTLTNHLGDASELLKRIEVAPLDFASPERLAAALAGVRVLYNTYWIRFPHGGVDHGTAVKNTRRLLDAARRAGVERIVHVSITNPSHDSHLSYFRGKAELEDAVRGCGVSYAILRPAVLFGLGDILINNIAWFLRRFPVFAILCDGQYSVQPIFVEDLAALAVGMGCRTDNMIADAVGPETYTYDELIALIRKTVRSGSGVVHVSSGAVHLASMLLGRLVGDVVLTRQEIEGLMANLLVSRNRPLGCTSLKQWLAANATEIGTSYASELDRHYRRTGAGDPCIQRLSPA